jgi:hypothetical protein
MDGGDSLSSERIFELVGLCSTIVQNHISSGTGYQDIERQTSSDQPRALAGWLTDCVKTNIAL